MTAEPVDRMWTDLAASNRSLLELTQQTAARVETFTVTLKETSKAKTKRKSKSDPHSSVASKPNVRKTKSPLVRGAPRRYRSTYSLTRDKLPGLVSRAKELVQSWNEPKKQMTGADAQLEKYRSACVNRMINHTKCEEEKYKQTSPSYILMELRKSLVRHDWSGVKELLKVFYRSSNEDDKVGWKACVTALLYYPGGEAALREFIEENKLCFLSRDILCGLLNINGMQKFNVGKKAEEQEVGIDEGDGESEAEDEDVLDER